MARGEKETAMRVSIPFTRSIDSQALTPSCSKSAVNAEGFAGGIKGSAHERLPPKRLPATSALDLEDQER